MKPRKLEWWRQLLLVILGPSGVGCLVWPILLAVIIAWYVWVK